MEVRDFLYQYTKIFFSELVKETILIENWEETDFDQRYVEYADIFLKIKDKCFANGVSDDQIIAILSQCKDNIVKKFNKIMEDHFRKNLKNFGIDIQNISEFMPEGIFCVDKINNDALKIFRDFEEKIQNKHKEK